MRQPRTKREHLEAAIEAAIALLDMMDGDSDFEEGCDLEPSLGWLLPSNSGVDLARPGNVWRNDDREVDAGDEGEPGEDEEHWLQPAQSPLVVVDTLGNGYSQRGELKYRFVRLQPTS